MAENIKRAIALGFFDGVHIGHGALLNKTKERAAEIGGMPSVLSFDVHPDNLVLASTSRLSTVPPDAAKLSAAATALKMWCLSTSTST